MGQIAAEQAWASNAQGQLQNAQFMMVAEVENRKQRDDEQEAKSSGWAACPSSRGRNYPMRMLVYAAAGLFYAGAALAETSTAPTVSYFAAHPGEQREQMRACANDPGTARHVPACDERL
jgi:hypothetical protein